MQDVPALCGVFNRRVLEVRKVLSRERKDRWVLGRPDRNEVSGRSLVAICRTPEREIGNCAEVRCRFDRLVCGSVLAKTNGVVGG